MKNAVKILKALSDQNRLRILMMLDLRTLCVCEITELLKLAPSTVSKHLSIMKEAGIILDEKNGKWVYYSLNPEFTLQNESLFLSIKNMLKDDIKILDDYNFLDENIEITACEIQIN